MKSKGISILTRRRIRSRRPAAAKAGRTGESRDQNLAARLSNCLQTILELEPDLEQLHFGHYLVKDFDVLKMFLTRIDEIEVQEGDVVRIEAATENFLRELTKPLGLKETGAFKKHVVQ